MIGQLKSLYDTQCEYCGGYHYNDLAGIDQDFNDEFYLQLAKDLMQNDVLINPDLHLRTAEILLRAISSHSDFDLEPDLEQYLKRNIYHFSAAKSFTQMKYYRDGMIDENGKLKSFETFHKWIADSGEIFNSTYLRAEYDMASHSAIMAHKWDTMDTEYLEFSTVGDNRVRPSHKVLDKFTAPKSDPIWRKIYPPLDWGCRCTVVPGKANTENRINSEEALNSVHAEIKDTIFENNVALSKVIYKNNHPYFIDSKGLEKQLSWNNYGLHSMDQVRTRDLPIFRTQELEVDSAIRKPSESWLNPDKSIITHLKFYKNEALIIQLDKNDRIISSKVVSIGNDKTINNMRKGVLIYR